MVDVVQHAVGQAHIQPCVWHGGVHDIAGGAHVGLVGGAVHPLQDANLSGRIVKVVNGTGAPTSFSETANVAERRHLGEHVHSDHGAVRPGQREGVALLRVEGYYRASNIVIHSLKSSNFFLHSNMYLISYKYDFNRDKKLTRVRIPFLNLAFQLYFFNTRQMRFLGEYG